MTGCYLDHITLCVADVDDERLDQLMDLLGFEEFTASEAYQEAFMKGLYVARWFRPTEISGPSTDLHFVVGAHPEDRGLEHVCFMGLGEDRYDHCRQSDLCVRDSGSGRVWLAGPGNIRVEVQP